MSFFKFFCFSCCFLAVLPVCVPDSTLPAPAKRFSGSSMEVQRKFNGSSMEVQWKFNGSSTELPAVRPVQTAAPHEYLSPIQHILSAHGVPDPHRAMDPCKCELDDGSSRCDSVYPVSTVHAWYFSVNGTIKACHVRM